MDESKNSQNSDYQKIKEKYPNRFPIIVKKSDKCKNLPEIDKSKFLVPEDLTVGQFVYIIRKRIKLTPEKSLYLFCDNVLPPTAHLMNQICNKNDYTYIYYAGENTFG